MKKLIIGIIIGLVCTSCTIETLSNGAFDGYWHMTKVDTISNGNSTNVSEERVYWAVEGKLLQVSYLGRTDGTGYSDNLGYYLRFSKSSSEIIVSDAYTNRWHEDWGDTGGDIPLDDTTQLHPYGIYELPETFRIEELDNSRMTLCSSRLRLHFRKQ